MADGTRISFSYSDQEGVPVYHVSGVWGGRTPENDLHAWLYLELPSAPVLERGVLDPETGQPVPTETIPLRDEAQAEYRRLFQCALVMDPRRARDLGMWLVAQAEAMLGEG